MPDASPQQEWRHKSLQYAAAVNVFVARGLRDGWDQAGDPPDHRGREHLVPDLLAALREANARGEVDGVRELWPLAWEPLGDLLEANGQAIPAVCILPDSSIVARIEADHKTGRTVRIVGNQVIDLPEIDFFGISPNRRYLAIAQATGVRVLDGWDGPEVAFCRWPTGLEDVPAEFAVSPLTSPPKPTELIPFPDGQRVLLVSSDGTFVLSPQEARRLLPTRERIEEHLRWLRKDYPDDKPRICLSMEHGAISKDGKLIAIGDQDSRHIVLNDQLQIVGEVGNYSEYPHYALFSADDRMIAFNSCHFYSGATVGVPTSLLPGLVTESYEEDSRTPLLEDSARVYAGVAREEEFIVGNADGYLLTFDCQGKPRGRHFIGSTICDMDLSADRQTLVVSTYAGAISIIKLDAGQAPDQIGDGNHLEARRWLFWKNEPKPLIW